MNRIVINEIPSKIWDFITYDPIPIDRSTITVTEYLTSQNIDWRFGDDPHADFRVYKDENLPNGVISIRRLRNEYQKRLGKIPYMNLNGEAQEWSRISYLLADPQHTYSVAPGNTYHRLYFPTTWSDPEVDSWGERLDRICWIGRPLPERIRLAKKLNSLSIPLDIYSRKRWPLPNWKGYADDEIQFAKRYKYKIVFENSLKHLYHSEKLFNGIKSGCVTFYISDPRLEVPHLDGAFLPFHDKNLEEREDTSDIILKGIENCMFTSRWEVYSFKNFYDMIINCARSYIEEIKPD